MAILDAPAFVTISPRDCRWLEHGLSLLLKERRANGQHDHPKRLFELLSELHTLADPTARRGMQPSATDLVAADSGIDSMSVMEAAKRLKVSGAMVRRGCDDGSLVAVKSNNQWRIHPESVQRLEAR
jgi:excisionase family DNA binding protein